MFTKNSEECYVDQHRGRICGAISMYAQQLIFVSMLLEEMTEVQNPSVINEDNQGAIYLVKNRPVVIRTNHIGVCHHFLRKIVEDKDVYIKYISI